MSVKQDKKIKRTSKVFFGTFFGPNVWDANQGNHGKIEHDKNDDFLGAWVI